MKGYKYPAAVRHRERRRRYKLLPGELRATNKRAARYHMALITMAECAELMGIHKSRVHQLERHALWKLRTGLRALDKHG